MSDYRVRLDRHVNMLGDKVYAFVGVNPSTADATTDDATVRKWNGFCKRLGARRYVVVNAFSKRATDVRDLRHVDEPIGLRNDQAIQEAFEEADVIVACWGRESKVPKEMRSRFREVEVLMEDSLKPVMCWGLTADGSPRHPLMLSYDTPLERSEFERWFQ